MGNVLERTLEDLVFQLPAVSHLSYWGPLARHWGAEKSQPHVALSESWPTESINVTECSYGLCGPHSLRHQGLVSWKTIFPWTERMVLGWCKHTTFIMHLYLLLLHQLHLRVSGIRSWRLGTPGNIMPLYLGVVCNTELPWWLRL